MIGIYLMGFVILVAGVGVLGTAIAYAVRPTETRLALLRPLSLAAIFAALCSMSVGIATALKFGAAGVATAKGPEDGHLRGWPEEVRNLDQIRDLVDRRWQEYALP